MDTILSGQNSQRDRLNATHGPLTDEEIRYLRQNPIGCDHPLYTPQRLAAIRRQIGCEKDNAKQRNADSILCDQYAELIERFVPPPSPDVLVEAEVCRQVGFQPSEFRNLTLLNKVILLQHLLNDRSRTQVPA